MDRSTHEDLVRDHHFAQTGLSVGKAQAHAAISIKYAISVLEGIQYHIGSLSPTSWQIIKDKKDSLKSLINQ